MCIMLILELKKMKLTSVFFIVCMLVLGCADATKSDAKMEENNNMENLGEAPGDYDFNEILSFSGESTRVDSIYNGVEIWDLEDTDENETQLSLILSHLEIPFSILRPEGWSSNYLLLHVAPEYEAHTREVIRAGIEQDVLEERSDQQIRGQGKKSE